MRGTLSVVPIKLEEVLVPVLPVKPQQEAVARAGVAQLANPLISEVSTLPKPCEPSAIFTVPTTCNLAEGDEVPMPTLAPSPSTKLLLCDTNAFAPMAVALTRFPLLTFAL